MRVKRLLSIGSVFVMGLLTITFLSAPSASAATCTWTGGGGNLSFTDTGNWTGCNTDGANNFPENGDSLVFDNTGASSNVIVTNNIPNLTLTSVSLVGTSTAYAFTIAGVPLLTLSGGGISNTSSGGALGFNNPLEFATASSIATTAGNINLDQVVSGSGAITKTGAGLLNLNAANIAYTGAITIGAGGAIKVTDASGLGTAAGSTTVNSTGSLIFDIPSGGTVTINEPLALNGPGTVDNKALEFTAAAPNYDYTGAISLNSADVAVGSNVALVLGGVISGTGGFTFTDLTGNGTGALTLEGTNLYSGTTTIGSAIVINGVQASSAVTVVSGGTLKGDGTVGAVTVQSGGRVAPGNSPGCLATGAVSFVSGSSLDVELAGTTRCTQYDGLNVAGTVSLGGATLNLALLSGFIPAVGNSFTIIDNDGTADAVTGTFAQGATVTAGGVTYQISYTGGDGNDVVLTVTGVTAPTTPPAAPGVPSTGIKALTSSPLAGLLVISMAAAIGYIARKRATSRPTNF